MSKPVQAFSSTKKDENDEENYDPHYEPLVSLEEVKVETGEENYKSLFSARCKLFRYVDSQWKERGVGDLKIQESNDDGKFRILMRRDQVMKLCANHIITGNQQLNAQSGSDKAWTWSAYDYADPEDPKNERLCAKFKTAEVAKEFEKVFNNCTGNNSKGRAESDIFGKKDDLQKEVEEKKNEIEEFKVSFLKELRLKLAVYSQLVKDKYLHAIFFFQHIRPVL